jgi:hypothetical protein
MKKEMLMKCATQLMLNRNTKADQQKKVNGFLKYTSIEK